MNATFKLSLPNDYQSEDDSAAMEAAEQDYEIIASTAKDAGLVYEAETDYGATWTGTDEQFAACVAALPVWAQRYASKVEE
jgi:hypothetical protein